MGEYRVTAPRTVLGHSPGEEFEAELEPIHEDRLIAGGALEVVSEKSETKSTKSAKADPTPASEFSAAPDPAE